MIKRNVQGKNDRTYGVEYLEKIQSKNMFLIKEKHLSEQNKKHSTQHLVKIPSKKIKRGFYFNIRRTKVKVLLKIPF